MHEKDSELDACQFVKPIGCTSQIMVVHGRQRVDSPDILVVPPAALCVLQISSQPKVYYSTPQQGRLAERINQTKHPTDS